MLLPLVRRDKKTKPYRNINYQNNIIPYPDWWPRYYNGGNTPCDVLQGPCSCGAGHSLNEWIINTSHDERTIDNSI